MHGVVFGCGDRLEVLRVVALHAANESCTEPLCEEGILSVGFLSPAPPRIAKDIDVGGPEIEAGRTRANAHAAAGQAGPGGRCSRLTALILVELGACLGADHGRHVENERLVESSAEADSLRKDRGDSLICHAVERFTPPVVSVNLKARYGGGGAAELGGRPLVRHSGNEVIHALVDWQHGIQIRGVVAGGCLLARSYAHRDGE